METQATQPGTPQASTPDHPIHVETQTLNALTEWVKNNPDNDPHAGTDLEEPNETPAEEKAVEKPDEKPDEKTEEKPDENVETIELPEDAPLFEIEYKTGSGKEIKKLSLKELREGWMAKEDYHRNIQKVKQQESQLNEQMRQAELKAQNEYVQKLEQHKLTVQKLAGVKTIQEIEALSKEDPAAAQQEFLRLINVNQTMQQIESEQRQAFEKFEADRQAALKQAVEQSRQTLASDVQGWNEDLYQKVLKTVTTDYGFNAKDVEGVYDARLIKVFHDAYQYRQLQRAKPELSKRVVTVPKVIKPGSGEKPNPKAERAEEAENRLRKTGRVDDAVAAYLARQQR